jgi:hypothetical protein
LAVPETKCSSVIYGKSSTLTAVGTTLTGGFGYIGPGPATGPEIAGTGGTAASATAAHTDNIITTGITKRIIF